MMFFIHKPGNLAFIMSARGVSLETLVNVWLTEKVKWGETAA